MKFDSGEQTTNTASEGWSHTFGAINGAKKPTIYKAIEAMTKDEKIFSVLMDSSQKNYPAPPLKRKDLDRNTAIKNAIRTYINQVTAETDKTVSSDEEMDQWNDEAAALQQTEWQKTPEMMLLTAIANCSRL